MSVAYQGEPGAFGHQACLAFLPGQDPVPRPSFAAVVDSVERGEAEYGILPIENIAAGPVAEALQALERSRLNVVDRRTFPVRVQLLGLPGSRLEEVRVVASHPIALGQCADTLRTLGLETEIATNTAVAAKELIDSGDRSRAVLASDAAAALYGLTVLRRDVHDRPDNATLFYVVAREER